MNETLSHGNRSSPRSTLVWAVAAVGVLMIAGGFVFSRSTAPFVTKAPTAEPTMPIVTAGSEIGSTLHETTARFTDGSRVELAAGGTLGVVGDGEQETRLVLKAGRAEFEVQKRPHRPFIVSARGVEVRVIGTRFEVELDPSRVPTVVRVMVMRGVVEVRQQSGGEPVRLTEGEHLDVVEGAHGAPGAPSAPDAPAEPAASGSAATKPKALDASQLFEAASAARESGDVAMAIRMYTRLLKQYPGDQRASVTALELGRLMMDARRDYPAAANSFRRAVAAAPNESLREDALARLVWSLDAMHDGPSCETERQRYLSRFPRGVHAPSVQGKCVGRAP